MKEKIIALRSTEKVFEFSKEYPPLMITKKVRFCRIVFFDFVKKNPYQIANFSLFCKIKMILVVISNYFFRMERRTPTNEDKSP